MAQVIFQPTFPGWYVFVVLLSPLLLPIALVFALVRIFSRRRHWLERTLFLVAPLSATMAFSSEYSHLGREHQFPFSFEDVIGGPIAFAGFTSASVSVLLALLFGLLRRFGFGRGPSESRSPS
jgi:chromate transport protein ChrA